MKTAELNRLTEQLRSQLTGDRDLDRSVLLEWADRYRGQEEAGPLLREIGLLLFQLDQKDIEPLTQQIVDQMIQQGEQAFTQATERIAAGDFAEALNILTPVLEEIDDYPLSEDCLWMDFNSFLDGLLYEDFFREEIGEREVMRHPLHPASVLYAHATSLFGLERFDEAREDLERLVSLDPVCPEYLCALADAYLHTGSIPDAWDALNWALVCASTQEEAAYSYYLLAQCCIAQESWNDASILLRKSLRVHPSPEAEETLAQLTQQTGTTAESTDEAVNHRCQELEIPTGRSEVVEQNMEFLASLQL